MFRELLFFRRKSLTYNEPSLDWTNLHSNTLWLKNIVNDPKDHILQVRHPRSVDELARGYWGHHDGDEGSTQDDRCWGTVGDYGSSAKETNSEFVKKGFSRKETDLSSLKVSRHTGVSELYGVGDCAKGLIISLCTVQPNFQLHRTPERCARSILSFKIATTLVVHGWIILITGRGFWFLFLFSP